MAWDRKEITAYLVDVDTGDYLDLRRSKMLYVTRSMRRGTIGNGNCARSEKILKSK